MATSFASIVADVYSLTNRDDLTAETNLAVRSATLKAHHSDDYIFDFNEYSIAFSTEEYYQTLDYKALIPLWRKPRYMRKYDNSVSPGMPGAFLEYIVPEKVIDEFGADRTDIFYVAGANVQIRSSTLLQYCLIGIYVNPDVTESGFNSWIANDYPNAIVFEAASMVFKSIGFTEQFTAFRDLAADARSELVKHAITGTGM